jgi:tetratricopeptide (TPR) repeat protein
MTDLLQQDGLAPQLFSHAQRLLARNPRDPNVLDLLAWGHFQRGETKEALEMTRRLVQLEPMSPHHHFKLGLLYETLGNLPLGMASLLRANALDEDGEIGKMALEAVSNLDQVQIEQLLARADADPHFRYRLQSNPEQTMVQTGYLLSPFGFQILQSFDFSRDNGTGLDFRPRTIH